MVAPNSEQVEYNIILQAAQALKDLKQLTNQASTFKEKVDAVNEALRKFSQQSGLSIKNVASIFKEIDRIMSDTHGKSSVFGKLGKEGWDEAIRGAEKFGKSSESAFQKVVNGINIIRIALGALVAMLLFNVIQAIQNVFSTAIQQAREFEATLYRIANAERQLSMEGIEVSVKELKAGINDIKKALPIFSKEDISQLVGSLATTTKEIGFTGEEILKLGAAVAILNVNSTETETLLQTQAKVTNALVSPQSRSIGNLGLSFGKAKIEAKALELGILQTGEAFDQLTEHQKAYIKYAIVLETAGIDQVKSLEELRDVIQKSGGDFEALNSYLESNDAKLAANSAAWKDLMTTTGQIILPFIPAATGFFKVLENGFNMTKVLVIEAITYLSTLGVVMVGVFTGRITSIEQFTQTIENAIGTFREKLVNVFFKEMPDDAPEWFKEGWGDLIREQAETATAAIAGFGEEVNAFDAEGFRNEIEKILEDLARAREDLDKQLSRKREDIELEYRRKAADAERDYLRKIADINRDAEQDLAKLKQKHREEDKKAEEEYQLKLWELRMRYLMDLEDALHARDARQVIRLQKQYEIDKEALRRKKEIEDKEREQNQESETEDIELRRQQRLEDARIEYEQKLADQRIAKQRELDDLAIWYAREQADLELATQRKLETLLRGWIDEKKLTAENAAEVYAILQGYFGPGGMVDQLYQYMRSLLTQPIPIPLPYPTGIPLPPPPTPDNEGDIGDHDTNREDKRKRIDMAEGGTLLATRPTNVLFGEGGPELATFIPINKIGKSASTILGGNGNAGMEGLIRMELLLSPDLEARMIEKSLNGVADVIVKVTDSK